MSTELKIATITILLTSPFSLALYEFLKDKILARLKYSGVQAIFLSDNSVYFGNIISTSKSEIILSNIYYIKMMQVDFRKFSTVRLPDEPALIKLGDELHGPTDKMTVNKNHVLFIENLKKDSQVVKAITEYESKN